jgi:hypothetical protein
MGESRDNSKGMYHVLAPHPTIVPAKISFQLPEGECRTKPTHSAHMWSLREIECDINIGLHYPQIVPSLCGPHISFEAWRSATQARLESWYQLTRQSVTLTEKIEFHELLYQMQILRLNRPSVQCVRPSDDMQKRALKAAIAMIKEYNTFEQLGKMFMVWHAAHCVVEAGVYLLSFVLAALETWTGDRNSLGGEDVTILTRFIQTFTNLMWKLAQRWMRLEPYAMTLSSIAASVLSHLQLWSEGNSVLDNDYMLLKEYLETSSIFSATHTPKRKPSSDNPPLDSVPGQHFASSSSRVEQDERSQTILHSTTQPGQFSQDDADTSQNTRISAQPYAAAPLEATDVDFGEQIMWDFSGVDSEEIFAAFLDETQMADLVAAPLADSFSVSSL